MAIVILGGLVTSTALNLLVLPTLALRYGKFTSPEGSGGSATELMTDPEAGTQTAWHPKR